MVSTSNYLPLLITLILIFVSYIFMGRDILTQYKKVLDISTLYANPEYRGKFRVGFLLVGVIQVILLFSITIGNKATGYYIGAILFILGALGSIIMGLRSVSEHYILHTIGGVLYFFGLALGAFFLTININIHPEYMIIMLAVIIVWGLFCIYQLPKKNRKYGIETAHMLLSFVWLMLISIANIIFS